MKDSPDLKKNSMKGSDTVKIQEVIDLIKKTTSLIPKWNPYKGERVRLHYEVELIKEGMILQNGALIERLERMRKAREEEVYE